MLTTTSAVTPTPITSAPTSRGRPIIRGPFASIALSIALPIIDPMMFSWLGAGLFAASLGWFVFSYFVRFPALPVADDAAQAVAWDVALFTLFAFHHSLFARDAVRLWVQRQFRGRERSVFVW